jgi:serpin B
MKKTRMILALVSLLLVGAMAVNMTGCSTKVQAKDLMEGITPNEVTALDDLSGQNAKVTDFAVRLFQAGEKNGENTLISPLSVLCALAMTANGAENETLQQMETVLGMTTQELNLYLYSYMQSLPGEEACKLSLANSIWFTEDERFTVNPDFLQTNADYYGADIYKAPFNNQTCRDINNWVKEKTDGMIPNILDRIPDAAVLYLVNALAFDAQWANPYYETQIRNGEFTRENGTKQNASFMYSTEHIYLEDENATGFMKKYKGGKYAFVAMLPNEGVSVSDYVASLDGAALNAMLSNPQYTTVYTGIPKFETEYDVEMSGILAGMGMTNAFDTGRAEFAKIGTSTEGGISISRVLHKTFISVNEKGTKAAASTIIEATDGCADPEMPKTVYLDRPFVYMLIDCENRIPFFVGTMMNVEQ